MSSELAYDVVDVFADAPFAGNQLAVVHGAEALADDQLLALAREFGFSETAFPSGATGNRYTVRIFTPGGEIPFAGHPTLGTAWVLRQQGLVVGDRLVQRCGAGTIEVAFDGDLVALSAPPRDLAGPVPADVVGALLDDIGLSAEDCAGETWAAGAGLTFVHLPVRPEALARARPGRTPVADLVTGLALDDPLDGLNLYVVSGTAPDVTVRSRVFVPELSVPEDPATGSAAVGLGMVLVSTGVLPAGGRYEVTQGVELGRPSRLFGRVEAVDRAVTRCHVGGRVFRVARGTVVVPDSA